MLTAGTVFLTDVAFFSAIIHWGALDIPGNHPVYSLGLSCYDGEAAGYRGYVTFKSEAT